jgi:23S rRNA maturation mini-RNase III
VGKYHKKLQWLLLTTVAPYKLTPRYHEWIKGPVNTKSNTKKINALLQIYPTAKLTDLETMLAVISDAAFNALLDDYDISIK